MRALVADDGPGDLGDGHDQAGRPDSEASDGGRVVLVRHLLTVPAGVERGFDLDWQAWAEVRDEDRSSGSRRDC
jgi:hypothetical protein